MGDGAMETVRARLPFETERELAENLGARLSRAGMDLPTDREWLPGTLLVFELSLASGRVVLRGEAVVSGRSPPDGPPGARLRFLHLDEESHRLLDRIGPPPDNASRDWVLGIDLGTEGVRVAILRHAEPEPVRIGEEAVLPSWTALDASGRLLAGGAARALAATDPSACVPSVKRWLGRRFEPATVRRAPFRAVEGERSEIAAVLRGEAVPLDRLCGELLRTARLLAEASLRVPVARAVIAVPAHFDERQRAAVARAAALSGLDLERLVSETAATARAYAAGRQLPRRRLAVIDLGAGTFSAGIVEVEGDSLEVVAAGGDSFLGGSEFDLRIAELLAQRFEEEEGVTLDEAARKRIRDASENAKLSLSSVRETEIVVPAVTVRGGVRVELRTVLTLPEAEAAFADLVGRIAEDTVRLLAARRLAPRDVDEVLLAGAAIRMPAVRRRLEMLFPRAPIDMSASSSVAAGAAFAGLPGSAVDWHDVFDAASPRARAVP